MDRYIVRPVVTPADALYGAGDGAGYGASYGAGYGAGEPVIVPVPGSKSITNRALLIGALAFGRTVLERALFSDDSRSLIDCLEKLGFFITYDEEKAEIVITGCGGRIPAAEASLNVGNAGTAARFLTAVLAFSGGTYHLDAGEQIKKRPMKPLLDALAGLGVAVTYEGEEGHFPFTICGRGVRGGELSIDTSVSSQFLSALLMSAVLLPLGLTVHFTGERKAMPYVDMTVAMMAAFGVPVARGDGEGADDGRTYIVKGQFPGIPPVYVSRRYQIEPDASAAGYFYAMAMLTGKTVGVRGIHMAGGLQNDTMLLEVFREMGALVQDTEEGTLLAGPGAFCYEGAHVNMNTFSDQMMTLAVVAAFAKTETIIEGVGHTRFQESDRMAAVAAELVKLGAACEMTEDTLVITPISRENFVAGSKNADDHIEIETYSDHRMAMAFSLAGLVVPGVEILDPGCVAKTFPEFYRVFEKAAYEV